MSFNSVNIKGDVAEFTVKTETHGEFTFLVDTEDVDKIAGYNWFPKNNNNCGEKSAYYICTNRTERLHRFIMDAKKGEIVDHINRNTMDNRKENLQIVTASENSRNRNKHKNNTSGYMNVFYEQKVKKWRVKVTLNKKQKHIGLYTCKHEAARVANMARRMYYGPHVLINEIKQTV